MWLMIPNGYLKPGFLYTRRELYEKFNAEKYKGIVHVLKTGSVFIFMGSDEHADRWEHGILFYHGSGSKGDQTMTGMNKALANAANNREDIHLFRIVNAKSGERSNEYIGEMQLITYPHLEDVMEKGVLRKKYIFQFVPKKK